MEVIIKRTFRSVGFRFDAHAVYLLCIQYGIDLGDMDKIPKESYTYSLCWNAHRSYCFEHNKKYMNQSKTKAFIDNLKKPEWDKIIETIHSTRAPESKGDKKKVQHGMISSSLAEEPEYVKTTS